MTSQISRRSFISAAGLSAAGALAAVGCAKNDQGKANTTSSKTSDSAAAPTKVTLCLDFTPNTNHLGFYIAKHEGWYAEESLDLAIIQPNDATAETLVGSNAAEFGVSYQDYMANAFDGGINNIVAIAALVQHNTSGIMSRAEDGISSPAKMEGHSYATWEMPVELAVVKQTVEADGGDFSKVKLVPCEFDDGVAALQTKLCDTVWEYEGWAVQRAELEDVKVGWFTFGSINPVFDYYTPVLITNTDYAKKNEAKVQAFMRATARGYEYAIEKPAEAAKIFCEEVPELDAKLVAKSCEFMAKEFKSDASQWGIFDERRWAAFFEWLNQNKLVKNTLDAADGFTNQYLPKA